MLAFVPVWHNSKIDLKGTSSVLDAIKLEPLSQWTGVLRAFRHGKTVGVLNKLALLFQLA